MPHVIGIDARKVGDFGIGTYVHNLVGALAELDHDNQYVLFVRPQGEGELDGLPANFRFIVEPSPVYSLRELVTLSWRLLRLRLDLYHATHYVLPGLVPCPSVVTIHDIIHLLYPNFLPNRLALMYAKRMIRRSLAQGSQIVAVSQNTKADLMSYFDVGPEKIQVVYNGVEESYRRRLPREDLDRWLRVLELEQPYVLFVGNPKPHKNLDNLIKAFARACKLHDFDARLVCVGAREGSDFKIRQRASQLGIEDRVRLVGHVAKEALPAIYQGAELFIYPTLYEGFGLPVVEAMASGVAVITSHSSALKEIAEGYAHLVDPLDVEMIANAIAHCLTDHEHRRSLATLGQRRAQDFTWQTTAQHMLEIYRQALEPHQRPGSTGPRAKQPGESSR